MVAWTFCTSGAAIAKAGSQASSTAYTSGALMERWKDEAEAQINTLTRYDWIANYAGVGTNFKQMLADLCSDKIASKIINYDLGAYTVEIATTMLDYLKNNSDVTISELKKSDVQDVVNG